MSDYFAAFQLQDPVFLERRGNAGTRLDIPPNRPLGARFGQRQSDDFFLALQRDDDDAVQIAEDEVSGPDLDALDLNRHTKIDHGSANSGVLGEASARKNRPILLQNTHSIAVKTVNYGPYATACARRGGHDLAPPGAISRAPRGQIDLSGLYLVQRFREPAERPRLLALNVANHNGHRPPSYLHLLLHGLDRLGQKLGAKAQRVEDIPNDRRVEAAAQQREELFVIGPFHEESESSILSRPC